MEKMTDVELQIMDCIWSIGTDVSPSQVLTLLNERFQRGWTLQNVIYLHASHGWKGISDISAERSGICLSSTNHKGCLF